MASSGSTYPNNNACFAHSSPGPFCPTVNPPNSAKTAYAGCWLDTTAGTVARLPAFQPAAAKAVRTEFGSPVGLAIVPRNCRSTRAGWRKSSITNRHAVPRPGPAKIRAPLLTSRRSLPCGKDNGGKSPAVVIRSDSPTIESHAFPLEHKLGALTLLHPRARRSCA
jgi:hypothetical protein